MTDSQPSAAGTPTTARSEEVYDLTYYSHHCARGEPEVHYERSAHWLEFFGRAAERIVAELAPGTVLDAGCAHGFLVESLCDRGVDAKGFDISEYAVSQAREDMRSRIWVGSVLDPIVGHYDVVTCVEVLEHLEDRDAATAVANLCAVTDEVLFSSSPDDYREATHLNVRPPEYWADLFARVGFVRDVAFDGSFLAWWAVRYRRRRDPWHRLVSDYEREAGRLRTEAHHRNAVILDQTREIAQLSSRVAELEAAAAAVPDLDRRLADAQGVVLDMEGRLRAQAAALIEASERSERTSFRVAAAAEALAHRVTPMGTRRHRAARAVMRGTATILEQGPITAVRRLRHRSDDGPAERFDRDYQAWLRLHEPDQRRLLAVAEELRRWPDRPRISVLLPVYNPEASWLQDAIDSVLNQAYDRWELCIADDASSRPHIAELLHRYAAQDGRVKVVYRKENGGIAVASNAALDLATGDYIALLDHDDVLRPHALSRMAEYLRTHEDADVIYSDEDKILVNGRRGEPFFKPDWSPEWLLAQNYMCHLSVLRRSLVLEVGGFRRGYDGSQDHDLLLRATEKARHIGHVPDVLYSWRQVPGSAALSSNAKPRAREAGRRAVEDALRRRGLPGHVDPGPVPGSYDVRYDVGVTGRVDVIIPTRDRLDLLRQCIAEIETRSTYPNIGIVIVDNESRAPQTLQYLETTRHQVVRAPGSFNFSRVMNAGVRASSAPFVIFLNNDAFVREPDWLERLVEQCQRSEVGAVGCQLRYPDGNLQHCGVGLGHGQIAFNLHVDVPGTRNVSAVTAACMMMRREVFEEVGGFDEGFAISFNDVDLCLRIREHGYRIVYTPHVWLEHDESSSRGRLHPADDIELFRSRWGTEETLVDPYISPNLSWPFGERPLLDDASV